MHLFGGAGRLGKSYGTTLIWPVRPGYNFPLRQPVMPRFAGDRDCRVHLLGRGKRGERSMKVRASVKKICDKCKIIKRNGVVRVICVVPKHKQRQG